MSETRRSIIPACQGTSFILKTGDQLRVIDPEGKQVADLFCFDLKDARDSLSAGRSMDYNDTLFLTEGHTLYSHRSEAMLRITQDSCGRHDFLMTPCSLRMFQIVSGNLDHHPSCHENLAKAFCEQGLGADRISTTFNIFMNVQVAPDGGIRIEEPLTKAGDSITFLALRDLVVGLTACSHEETNAGRCKPIEFEILASTA